jgi:hypothetical protein
MIRNSAIAIPRSDCLESQAFDCFGGFGNASAVFGVGECDRFLEIWRSATAFWVLEVRSHAIRNFFIRHLQQTM